MDIQQSERATKFECGCLLLWGSVCATRLTAEWTLVRKLIGRLTEFLQHITNITVQLPHHTENKQVWNFEILK